MNPEFISELRAHTNHATLVGMSLSFRISEDEYIRAAIAHVEGHVSSKVGLCMYFMLAAMSLHLLIMLTYGQMFSSQPLPMGLALVLYVALIGLIIVPALWRILWIPSRYSRAYRRSPTLQTEMRAIISERGYAQDSDVGEPLRKSWNKYQCWREFRDVILLIDSANNWEFNAINTVGLPDWQREQLHELLNSFLPKR